jgi:photosystem II stability/assembly factor-like uncharacterized protein
LQGEDLKKLLVFLALSCFAFSASAWNRSDYLIKIDGIDRMTLDCIRNTNIEVYAKTANFWLAGADEEDLESLIKEKKAFQILDQEANIGEHYLIWARPSERMQSRLEEVEFKSQLLFADENIAVVKGSSKNIEELASLGFSLKKIHRRPLPLESKEHVSWYLESLSLEYDPLIDSIVSRVDQSQLFSWVDELTGEEAVLIGGAEDSIKTRYSWSDGIFKAAHYLKESFEQMGLSAEFDTFQVGARTAYLLDVACSPGGQKAWSVSLGGGIVKTTDGGYHWSLVDGTDDFTLRDICRVDDDTLWSVGKRGIIIRSTDGGNTWENKSKPEFSESNFKGSFFEYASLGWVVGDERILFTSDGGTNWIEQAQVVGNELYSVDFVDSLLGWTVGENGTILHTTNRGASWSPQLSGTFACLMSIDFVDLSNGWAVGDNGWAIYTTNGGQVWTHKDLSVETALNNVDFVDSQHGWIVGSDGSIFQTSDLGANWTLQPSNSYYLYGIDFADTLTGWASGMHDIIKTTNGGQNWFSQYDHLEYPHLLNVVCTIDGRCYPGRQFLITGHYDDESEDPFILAPGADDNASSVVALLAAASILQDYGLANTVKFVVFSGEEQGLLGSAAYAEMASDQGDTIMGVLNCDMIAYDGNSDRVMEVHSGLPAENQALADILIGAISDYGLDLVPEKITDGASHSSDHASFWDFGFPAILGHEDYQDRNPYMHSTQDRVMAFDSAYYLDFVKAAVAGISILGDPFISGDVNGDGLIAPGDVVYLLNYLYRAGTVPEPLQAGDVNCDGMVDAGDVVYLISYLFRGSEPPSC